MADEKDLTGFVRENSPEKLEPKEYVVDVIEAEADEDGKAS
jgi:hypothetical protein